MDRKVIVKGLNGSPRKHGNTALLIDWVLQGCQEAGAEVECLHIADYHVEYCRGCNRCLVEGICPLPDDYLALCEKLKSADGLVIGSPVYASMPTAQIKTFTDRTTLLNLYTGTWESKLTIGVATSGLAPGKSVARGLADMFGAGLGTICAKTSTLKHGNRPLAAAHNPKLPLRAKLMGKRLVAKIRTKNAKRSLKVMWIQFLRKRLLSIIVNRFPQQFTGVIAMRPDVYGVSGSNGKD